MEQIGKKLVAAALAAAMAVGAGVMVSQPADAQDQPTQTERDDTRADRMQQREERLQAKVDSGRITQERADEIRARMADRAARREARHDARAEQTDTLAAILGTTADDLVANLRAGASLADLAADAGVDIEVLIDQIEATRLQSIDQAVADGRIDQARADERLETLRDRITARVNGERPEGRSARHGRGHRDHAGSGGN